MSEVVAFVVVNAPSPVDDILGALGSPEGLLWYCGFVQDLKDEGKVGISTNHLIFDIERLTQLCQDSLRPIHKTPYVTNICHTPTSNRIIVSLLYELQSVLSSNLEFPLSIFVWVLVRTLRKRSNDLRSMFTQCLACLDCIVDRILLFFPFPIHIRWQR